MQIIERENPHLVDASPRRALRRPAMAQLIALASLADVRRFADPHAEADVIVGGGCGGDDYIENAKRQALNCLPPGMRGMSANGACQPKLDANGNPIRDAAGNPVVEDCGDKLPDRTIGGQQAGALAAAAAFSVTINVQEPFMPLTLSIPDNVAGSVKITSIMYGTDSMLPAAMVSGGSFSNKNTVGGYRLKGKKWLWPGQTIVIAGTAVAAIAADLLMIDSHGLTLA